MPQIPIDAVSAAEFLVRRMYRQIGSAKDARFFAVAETEHLFGGDSWFWTDDNAKVLEFLVRPELRHNYADEAGEILRFLRLMCGEPFIFRRVSMPRLELTGQSGTTAHYYHSLMHIRCDLSRGAVIAGIRFHDNRTADNLLLSANCVEFTHRGRRYTLSVEEAITEIHAAQEGHVLTLRHSGEMYFQPRWRPLRLGRVSYIYTIDARSMLISVEVVLDLDQNASVADIVLTVGHDHLSHGTNDVHYNTIFADRPEPEAREFIAGEPGRGFLPAASAGYYSIVQGEIAGFALAIHSKPRDPGRLVGIETLVRERGRLHFARARYRFEGAFRGTRLTVAEDKLLTAGGFYQRVGDYARLMRDTVANKRAREAAVDFSVSYDYGAELNALSKYFSNSHNRSQDAQAELKDFFDKYLNTYLEMFVDGHYQKRNTIFSRQLAFVILSVVTMYRATGGRSYFSRLTQLCDVMLDFEKRFDDIASGPASGFMLGVHSQRSVFVDCHSAALLALTQAAQYIDDPRLTAAIDRGLGSYCVETAKVDWIDGPHKVDVVAVSWLDDHGTRHTNNAFWNYHAGLTLRFFAALRNTSDPALQAIAARHRDRITLFDTIFRLQIASSMTWHHNGLELRSSVLSTETNSETQPWVMLGLLGDPCELNQAGLVIPGFGCNADNPNS